MVITCCDVTICDMTSRKKEIRDSGTVHVDTRDKSVLEWGGDDAGE